MSSHIGAASQEQSQGAASQEQLYKSSLTGAVAKKQAKWRTLLGAESREFPTTVDLKEQP